MKKLLVLILGLVLAGNLTAGSRLYKWVDENGKISYHDKPPPTGSGIQSETMLLKSGPGEDEDKGRFRSAVRSAPITLYVTSRCASCDLARSYFKDRSIPFKELNVESNDDLKRQLQAVAGELTVPVVTVGSKVLKGYSSSWFEAELREAGYLAPKEETGQPQQ